MVRMKTLSILMALAMPWLASCGGDSLLDLPCRTDLDCPAYFICLNSGTCHLPDNGMDLLDGDVPWPFNNGYTPEPCDPQVFCKDSCEGNRLVHCEPVGEVSWEDCSENACACAPARICRDGCAERDGVGHCLEDGGGDPLYCDSFTGGCFEDEDPLLSGSLCEGSIVYLAEPVPSLENPCVLDCTKTLVEICDGERCRQATPSLALCRSDDCSELTGGCFPGHDPRTSGLICQDGDVLYAAGERLPWASCEYGCSLTLYEDCPLSQCYQTSVTSAQCLDSLCPDSTTGCVPGDPEREITRCSGDETKVVRYASVPSRLDPCLLECVAQDSETCLEDLLCRELSSQSAACLPPCQTYTGGCNPTGVYGDTPIDEPITICDDEGTVLLGTPVLDDEDCLYTCTWSTEDVCEHGQSCRTVAPGLAACSPCEELSGGCYSDDPELSGYSCIAGYLYRGETAWVSSCSLSCEWSLEKTCQIGCTDNGGGNAYCNEDPNCPNGVSGGCFPDDPTWDATADGLTCYGNGLMRAIPVTTTDPCRYACNYQVQRYCDPGFCVSERTGEAHCEYCDTVSGGCFPDNPEIEPDFRGFKCVGQHRYRARPTWIPTECRYECTWEAAENCAPTECVEVGVGEAYCAGCTSVTGGCTRFDPNLGPTDAGRFCLNNVAYHAGAVRNEANPCVYDCILSGYASCGECEEQPNNDLVCNQQCVSPVGGCDADDPLSGGTLCIGGSLYLAYPVQRDENNPCLLDCHTEHMTTCPTGTCTQVEPFDARCGDL